ncbi:MAG TPA: O-antigen ligase family protein [Ignavibacteriales bacterium]|nr:O-antigen ligase family protein [Ignavibacteriales bacterium]
MNFNSGISRMENKTSVIKILDGIIFGCAILFLVSTNNSIFVNQLGYYGALLCIITEYFLGKNRFKRTGLEVAFLLFILIEVVAAFFSFNERQAFSNVLRRFLLIPTVYTILASADDFSKAKLFFKVYLGAAFLTITFYLGFAVKYFLSNLYVVQGKGPSVFQYVMTAGGLISFTTIFFFAFLINERGSFKVRIFYLAGFLLSLIALVASDTRAAWIGTAAALFLILVVKRKWLILAPMIILLVAVIFLQKNKSVLHVYKFDGNSLVEEKAIPTMGRATGVYSENDDVYLCDYDNGILEYKNLKLTGRIPTPFPVQSMEYWTDSTYVARLLDLRFLLFKKSNGKMKPAGEFTAPGLNVDYFTSNGRLYLADSDSGLTVLSNPDNLKEKVRFPEINKIKRMSVDSSAAAVFDGNNNLDVYRLSNGLPKEKIFSRKFNTSYGFLYLKGDRLLFTDNSSLRLFHIDNGGLSLTDSNSKLQGVSVFGFSMGRLVAVDYKGNAYDLEYPIKDKLVIKSEIHINYQPLGLAVLDGGFAASEVKRSRIGSMVDPYHPSNVERMNLWKAGSRIVREHPLFGVGDIDMQNIYKLYRDYYDKETYGHFHNNYVHFLVALGIPGFIIVMFLIISILAVHVKIYNALKSVEFASSYALGAMAAFIGFLGSGLAEWNFGDHEIITMVWFTLGLNLAFYLTSKRKDLKAETGKIEETVLNPKQL